MTRLHAAAATDAGHVRTSNQDLALVADDLIAVADGMGGHAGGEVAARTAVDALERAFHHDSSANGLRDAASAANREVFQRAEREQALRGMGTTLTAAALVRNADADPPEQIALVNVGDSRAYLFEDGQLRRLTEDHSLVEEMVRHGELTPEAALTHPHRHILTRALGIDSGVEIDSWMLALPPGSRLLLCSDGLTNECTEEEIAAVLGENAGPADAAQQLVARALGHGGNDNVTVVVADFSDSPPSEDEVVGAIGAADEQHGDANTASELAAPKPSGAARATASAFARGPGTPRPRLENSPHGPRPRPNRPARRAPRATDPIVTVRVAFFVLVLIAILGGIAGFVVWFNRATYYVGIANGHVAIYQGRPGGFLWFKPTLVTESPLATDAVLPANLPMLREGILESSYDGARLVVTNLSGERSLLGFNTFTSRGTSSNSGTGATPSSTSPGSPPTSKSTVNTQSTATTGVKSAVSN